MVQHRPDRDLKLNDPPQVPYEAYLAMAEGGAEAIEDWFNVVRRPIYLNILQEQAGDWLLVCGEEVAMTSNPAELPGPEEIEQLAREKKRVPSTVSLLPEAEDHLFIQTWTRRGEEESNPC